jgi:uncharacterized protein
MLRLVALATFAASPSAARPRDRPVRSMVELRREKVVQQRWDLSCGAAALSTVLTHDLRDPVSEREIVTALLTGADADAIRERGGFSLLDLKRYAVARGYAAAGFGGLELAGLLRLGVAIVPTVGEEGPHFVIFRGATQGRVVLADPSYGARTLTPGEFEAIWSPRVAFVVRRSSGEVVAGATDAALVQPRVMRDAIRGRR